MNTNWIRRADPRNEGEHEGRPLWNVRDVRERRNRLELDRIERERLARGADTDKQSQTERSARSAPARSASQNA